MPKRRRERNASMRGSAAGSAPGGPGRLRRALGELGPPLGLASVSTLLLWLAFPPADWGWCAWFALVPLACLLRTTHRTGPVVLAGWLAGWAFYLLAVHWIRYADPKACLAWVALALYLSAYPLVWCALGRLVCRWRALPLCLAVPILHVPLEYARAYLLTGFAWFYLGHTQYRYLAVTQIADWGGVYAVSFVVAMCNGALADVVLAWWGAPRGSRWWAGARVRWAVAGAGAAVVCTLGYGVFRLEQSEFTPGPRVAAIQGNEPQRVKSDARQADAIMRRHINLTLRAAAEKPDLIVWPETMFRSTLPVIDPDADPAAAAKLGLTLDHLRRVRQQRLKVLADIAASPRVGTALLIGVHVSRFGREGASQHNSAVYVSRDGTYHGRYDKMHLVPFGEYLPLGRVFPWLAALTPYEGDYSLREGTDPVRFELDGHHLAVIICYESTVPRVVRRLVRGPGTSKAVDFLLNISNDGWFRCSSELDQHLAMCTFRAIEARVPIVRSVNTGISAMIAPDGGIRQRLRDEAGRCKCTSGVLVAELPLDTRVSPYLLWGDAFAQLVSVGLVGLVAAAVVRRRGGQKLPERC